MSPSFTLLSRRTQKPLPTSAQNTKIFFINASSQPVHLGESEEVMVGRLRGRRLRISMKE
jgi:hypothetical protein